MTNFLNTFFGSATTGALIAGGNIAQAQNGTAAVSPITAPSASGQNSFSTVLSQVSSLNLSPELVQLIQAQGGTAELSELLQTNGTPASAAGLLGQQGAIQQLVPLVQQNNGIPTTGSGEVIGQLLATSPDGEIINPSNLNLDGLAGNQSSSPGNPDNPSITGAVVSTNNANNGAGELPDFVSETSNATQKPQGANPEVSGVVVPTVANKTAQQLVSSQTPGKEVLAKIDEIIEQAKTENVKQIFSPVTKATGENKEKAENALKTASNNKENTLIETARNTNAERVVETQKKVELGAYQKNSSNTLNNSDSLPPANNSVLSPNVGRENIPIQNIAGSDVVQLQSGGVVQNVDQKFAEVIKTENLIAQNNKANANSPSEQVSLKIANMVKTGDTKITLQLEPLHLGKIEIKIEVPHEGRASVVVLADKADTLDTLQKDARSLEKALQDSGLKTDSGSLSFGLKSHNEQLAQEGSKAYQHGSAGNDGAMGEIEETGSQAAVIYQSDKVIDIKV